MSNLPVGMRISTLASSSNRRLEASHMGPRLFSWKQQRKCKRSENFTKRMEISKKRWLKISTHPNLSVILVVRAVPLIREKYLFVTCVKSFLLQATIIPGFARQKRIVLYVENSFLRSSYYLQLNQVSDVHTKLIFVFVAQRSYRHIGVSIVFLRDFWWNNLQEFNIGAKK